MTREMQRSIKKNKADAAGLVRFANPKSRTRPSIEWVKETLSRHIPYVPLKEKPAITEVTVTRFSRNRIIKSARFEVELDNGQVFEMSAFQNLVGRTPEEKEADKTADFPSGLFNIFREEVTMA